MLKIQKSADGTFTVFHLCGRIRGQHVAELKTLFAVEKDFRLDLRDVNLVDREAVRFLVLCESKGIAIDNCPAYIREWMMREKNDE